MRRPIDTSVEALERQLDAYRAMTPEQRLRLSDEMSTVVRSLARSCIRARSGGRPAAADVDAELARMMLGPEGRAAARARQPSGPR